MTLVKTGKPIVTPKGRARKEEVFRTAARLMVQNGFGGTSISDIAKVVGLTKAGLYHHITGKQDLLFQILQYAFDEMERLVFEPVKQVQDPEQRLTEIIRLHVRVILDGGLEFTLLYGERHHLDDMQQDIIVQRMLAYMALVGATLQELVNEGKLRDLDTQIATFHLLQTISGIARWYPKFSEISEDHLVEQTVNYSLSAILKC